MVPDIWNFEHSYKLHLLHSLEMIQELHYSFYPPSVNIASKCRCVYVTLSPWSPLPVLSYICDVSYCQDTGLYIGSMQMQDEGTGDNFKTELLPLK